MSAENLRQSPHPVLPPIITSERDGHFLQEVSAFIDVELSSIQDVSEEQRYVVYRAAFDKVIEHVTAYKPLLTAIKAEYEECIDTIIRGKQEAFYLNGKLKAMASEPSTVRNYRKRCDELEDRLNIVRGNNDILRDELEQQRLAKMPHSASDTDSELSQPVEKPPDRRQIPGLTMDESTDPVFLTKELGKLEKRLRDLQISRHINYQPRARKDDLKKKLQEKEQMKEQLHREQVVLKVRVAKLQVANQAAKLYNELAGPYTQETLGDVVVGALRRYKRGLSLDEAIQMPVPCKTEKSLLSFGDEDDPVKEREADAMMDYINRFNQLFDQREFEAAAAHAANSPQGVLRTMTTLAKFKSAVADSPGDPPPLLWFCAAVMASVRALDALPPADMAAECVQCALDNGKLDLLTHWVGQQLFTPSEKLGDLISQHCTCPVPCVCQCQAMAQNLYTASRCHLEAVGCLLKQGRVLQAYQFARSRACLDQETSLDMLELFPSLELARLLVLPVGEKGKVKLALAVKTLLESRVPNVGCQLLEEVLQGEDGREILNSELETSPLSEQEWETLADRCREFGYSDVSMHLMAAFTVHSAVKTAAILLAGSGV